MASPIKQYLQPGDSSELEFRDEVMQLNRVTSKESLDLLCPKLPYILMKSFESLKNAGIFPENYKLPSIYLFRSSDINRFKITFNANSTRPDNDKRGFGHYAPGHHAIFLDYETINEYVNKRNYESIIRVICEELIHAATTVEGKAGRSGFIHIDELVSSTIPMGIYTAIFFEKAFELTAEPENSDAVTSTENLTALIVNLLDYSRIEGQNKADRVNDYIALLLNDVPGINIYFYGEKSKLNIEFENELRRKRLPAKKLTSMLLEVLRSGDISRIESDINEHLLTMAQQIDDPSITNLIYLLRNWLKTRNFQVIDIPKPQRNT